MMEDHHKLAGIMKVLAVSTRVCIVQLLRERTLCVNALAARLDVTQGAVSQHLRVMRDADLVIDERRGCRIHYSLNEETLEQWRMEIDALLTPKESSELKTPNPELTTLNCTKGDNHVPQSEETRMPEPEQTERFTQGLLS